MEELINAKKFYSDMSQKVGEEDEKSIFDPKSDKSNRKKNKEPSHSEDVFREKKKADKKAEKKGGPYSPKGESFRPKCEDEMDLIEE